MKTAMIIWNLVFFISIRPAFGIAATKRHDPGPDEIERVINETHSFMWSCKRLECHPGLGMNVRCGTSISFSTPIMCVSCVKGVNFSNTSDYSPCKRCKMCSKHEEKTGECTLEEDTTDCLGICHKGFYWDSVVDKCQPCSECCGQRDKYHEKECEDSGLPSSKQCRENNFNCSDMPTKNTTESLDHDNPEGSKIPTKNTDTPTKNVDHDNQEGLEALEIVGVVVSVILIAVFIIVVVIGVVKGWHGIGSTLMSCFHHCFHIEESNGGSTMHFDVPDHQVQISKCDPELGTAGSGHNCTETSNRSTELSDLVVHQEMQAQPPAERKKTQREFSRSYSDPGASHVKPGKVIAGSKCNPAQFLASPKPKRLSKGGYSLVALDELPDEDVFTRSSSKSTDAGVQQPRKPERLAEPSMKTQHTSTTSLYLHVTGVASQLNGIPQDFLNNLLSKQVSVIPYRFYSRICVKLNTLRELAFDDYRLFGEEIGLSKAETSYLGQLKNPTHEIIEKFEAQRGSCIGKFREILEQMERIDVVDVIDEWLKHEWLIQCDFSQVDGRPQTFI